MSIPSRENGQAIEDCGQIKGKTQREAIYSHFFSVQFHCWGNTIQLGHHDSFDKPPSKPFFGVTKKATSSVPGAVSPDKHIIYDQNVSTNMPNGTS